MLRPEWRVRPAPPPGFAESLGLPPIQARLLHNRGVVRAEDVGPFMAADTRLLHDYRLLPDIDEAVERVVRAVSSEETIAVYGDFDTDGVSGTAVLVHALRELGGSVVTYLPDRVDEGHGLNTAALDRLSERGVTLLITVDCGVGAVYEVAHAQSLGMDTIVTDHHAATSPVPSASPVVNPGRVESQYPSNDLTGAGLAYKLAEAVWAAEGRPAPVHLLELAALGTVADVAPLLGENRYIVGEGLKRMNRTKMPGLKALIEVSGKSPGEISSETLSFSLIPRLNAAGRLGDAALSLDLLTATSGESARKIAETLDEQNFIRRQLTEEALDQAQEQTSFGLDSVPPIIVVEDARWTPGILGLVAGRLSEQYHRPAIAVSTTDGESRGSARSIAEFNIVAALDECGDILHRFGGHPRAAGFSLPSGQLADLRSRLEVIADRELGSKRLAPYLDIDAEVPPSLLLGENLRFIESLEPFGAGNPTPLFMTRDLEVTEARRVGDSGDHLKMWVSHNGTAWNAIAFRQGDSAVQTGDKVDMVYSVEMNEWQGRKSAQMKVVDIRPVEPAPLTPVQGTLPF